MLNPTPMTDKMNKGALVALCAAISACSSSGTSALTDLDPQSDSQATGGTQTAIYDEYQDPRAYCPKTVMRAGTETINIYPDDLPSDDPDRSSKLRFRGTITEVVRECNYGGPNLYMKVGVAGRVLSGPSGETGSFTMPIRVAVTKGDELLYSKLHEVPVEIPPGRTNTNFTYVDSQIVMEKPEGRNILVYVGYDEQRVDIPGARPVQNEQQRVN